MKNRWELTEAVEELEERVARLQRTIEEIEVSENKARLKTLL